MPVLGAVAAVVSIAGTVKGMSDSRKAQKAGERAADEAEATTREHNADSLELMKKQQKATEDLRRLILDDTQAYTVEKGMEILQRQYGMGYETLLFEARKASDQAALLAAQQGRQTRLVDAQAGRESALLHTQQGRETGLLTGQMARDWDLAGRQADTEINRFDSRAATERTQSRAEANQTITETLEKTQRDMTKATFDAANKQAELAVQEQAALDGHTTEQTMRAMKRNFGMGRIVASEAARGVAGGSMAAMRGIAREDALMQQASDVQLKMSRGLMGLARLAADADRQYAVETLGQNYKNTYQRTALSLERMEGGIMQDRAALAERASFSMAGLRNEMTTRAENVWASQQERTEGLGLSQLGRRESIIDNQQAAYEAFAFGANKNLEGSYMNLNQGMRAGVADINVKVADLDFQYGLDVARAAVDDAFKMESALIDQKNNVSMMGIRNSYNNTMGSIQSQGDMWRGASSIANSLFNTYKEVSPMFATPAPLSYFGPSYSGGGMAGSNAIGGSGMLGGGV